jgi:lycopene beta-cyclase
MRMMSHSFFADKKILVIDQSEKKQNDRTWCFWEKESGLFESIVHHQWRKADFFSNDFSGTLDLLPYQYKMIRGIDLYSFVRAEAIKYPNIEWRNEKILSVNNENDKAVVKTETSSFTAQYIFNSILFKDIITPPSGGRGVRGPGKYLLLQHFKGLLIQTKEPAFDAAVATLMDFRISQQHGTAFMYVLPTSATTALVEYTLFTEKLLAKEDYETALQQYIGSFLKIKEYTVVHEEFGVIPMTNQFFPLQEGQIIQMGVAGGQVKGSSGYAFRFIQKRTQQLVQLLVNEQKPFVKNSFNDRKFRLYDSALLHVLSKKKMPGDKIFAAIFKKNPPKRVLQFLDNESNLYDDLRIMQSVPQGIFLPAAFYEMIR